MRQADRDAGPGDGLKSAEGEELVRLRRENKLALPLARCLDSYQGNLMTQRFMIRTWPLLAKVACSVLLLGALGDLSAQTPQPTAPPAHTHAAAKPVPAVRTNLAKHVPRQAHMYYEGVWGVEALTVKYTESGEIIRFSYRVIDPEKAATLNDKKAEPSLIDPQAGVKLVVPQMEKIGKLRQSSTPIADKSYWIAFSNSGRRVRPGDRVDVEIGNFRAQGLLVE